MTKPAKRDGGDWGARVLLIDTYSAVGGGSGRTTLRVEADCHDAELARRLQGCRERALAELTRAAVEGAAAQHRERFGHLAGLRAALAQAEAERARCERELESANRAYQAAMESGGDVAKVARKQDDGAAALARAVAVLEDRRQALERAEAQSGAAEALKASLRAALVGQRLRASEERAQALRALFAAIEPLLERLQLAREAEAAAPDEARLIGQALALAWREG